MARSNFLHPCIYTASPTFILRQKETTIPPFPFPRKGVKEMNSHRPRVAGKDGRRCACLSMTSPQEAS